MNKDMARNFKVRSISKRVSWTFFFTTLLIFLIIGITVINRSHNALLKSFDLNLLNTAQGLASLTDMEENGEIELDLANESMPGFNDKDFYSCFLILTLKDRKEIARSPSLHGYNVSIPDILKENALGETVYWYGSIADRDIRFIAFSKEIVPDPEDVKPASINKISKECLFIVGEDLTRINNQFNEISHLTIITLSIGLIILIIIGRFILIHNLKPLNDFKNEVKLISSSNLIPVSVPDIVEIKSIAETLNSVIDQLKDAFDRERRFTSNVAHELRTPISEIRALVEVVIKYSTNLSKEDYENYSDILESVKHMQNIVNTLLVLTRLDVKTLITQNDLFSLKTLILNIYDKYKPMADQKEITIINNIESAMLINYDKEMINTIIENLISNAIEYSPNNSTIEIDSPSNSSIFITNEVKNLSQEDLPLMFERFWRKDESRSSNTNHCGLGLSLVKSLVELLNLEIKAELVGSKLIRITISGFIVEN